MAQKGPGKSYPGEKRRDERRLKHAMPILSARERFMVCVCVFSQHDVTFLSVVDIGRIAQIRRDVKPGIVA